MKGDGHITLLQLTERIRETLHSSFAAPIWVSAEISQIQNHSSGHCYLELIEKGEGQSQPQAQVRATIWRSSYGAISSMFTSQTGCELGRGMKILARVEVTFHPSYGLSLQIRDIDPTYTVGDMERVKRETISRLKADGVWSMNREITMPYVPQNIAIISSTGAAGYQDFCNQIASLPYKFNLTLYPATMQGEAAEESIILALEDIAQSAEPIDVVVIIRGGGSTTDMNCFNSYRLCANVAQFPLPVITGIGHQRDESVADMVASTPLKTPTAVAVWLGERAQKVDEWLANALAKVVDSSREIILKNQNELRVSSRELSLLSLKMIEVERERLSSHQSEVKHSAQNIINQRVEKLSISYEQIAEWSKILLASQLERLNGLAAQVDAQSPQHILAMGFAMVQHNSQSVTSVEQVKEGDRVTIRLKDGCLITEVKG